MKQGEADAEVERLRKEQETVPLSFGDVAEAFERGEEVSFLLRSLGNLGKTR